MRQHKQCIVTLNRHKENDILGRPVFSITGVRQITLFDRALSCVLNWFNRRFVNACRLKDKIFKIESNETLPCALEVYPGEEVQNIIWSKDAKSVDPRMFEI